MCHHCIIEGVRHEMFDRRSFFGLAAATASVAVLAPRPAAAAETGKLGRPIDLTHETFENFPTYFGEQQFFVTKLKDVAKDGFNLNEWRLIEHTGTHMDAPLHFAADGKSIAEIPLENLVAPLVAIDIRERAAGNVDSQLTPDDVKAWNAANGPLPAGCCVAMNSGWDAHVASDKFRNADAEKKLHFPGFHVETVKMLLEDGNAAGIAVDTLSLDYGLSPDFITHKTWLPTGRWALEAVANLGSVPASGATLVVGASKLRGGTGGPCRLLAFA